MVRLKSHFSTIAALLWFFVAAAETPLSGAVGDRTLDASGNPYLVTDNITVAKGKTLTIKAGTVLLFKEYTGLTIEGSLVVDGSAEEPVVFTSVKDNRYNPQSEEMPASFAWNGIEIKPQAERVGLSNFLLRYSVYGLKAQTERIAVVNGVFSDNGQFNMTVHDSIVAVQEKQAYTYTSRKGAAGSKKSISPVRAGAYASGIAGLVSLGGAAFLFVDKASIHRQYLKESDQTRQPALLRREGSALTGALVCGGVGVALVATSAVLFAVPKDGTRKAVQVVPILGLESIGFVVRAEF